VVHSLPGRANGGAVRDSITRSMVCGLSSLSGPSMWGQVRSTIRALLAGRYASTLARALAELGCITKSLFLLAYLDDEAYRRRVLTEFLIYFVWMASAKSASRSRQRRSRRGSA
jgi:Tn3 transposase DDE domain